MRDWDQKEKHGTRPWISGCGAGEGPQRRLVEGSPFSQLAV